MILLEGAGGSGGDECVGFWVTVAVVVPVVPCAKLCMPHFMTAGTWIVL